MDQRRAITISPLHYGLQLENRKASGAMCFYSVNGYLDTPSPSDC